VKRVRIWTTWKSASSARACPRKPARKRRRAEEAAADVAMSAEATVVRNYVDVLVTLPWKEKQVSHDWLPRDDSRRRSRTAWRK